MSTATFNQTRFDELTAKIEYSARFVPFSLSRNKNEKHRSLNWTISLRSSRTEFSTDYSQGVGHIPNFKFNDNSIDYRNAVNDTCESGLNRTEKPLKKLNPPAKADVFYSLLLDSDVLDYSSFEEWASELGYDTDSRNAEKTYNACLEIALKFRQFFSEAELAELRELFSDY